MKRETKVRLERLNERAFRSVPVAGLVYSLIVSRQRIEAEQGEAMRATGDVGGEAFVTTPRANRCRRGRSTSPRVHSRDSMTITLRAPTGLRGGLADGPTR